MNLQLLFHIYNIYGANDIHASIKLPSLKIDYNMKRKFNIIEELNNMCEYVEKDDNGNIIVWETSKGMKCKREVNIYRNY